MKRKVKKLKEEPCSGRDEEDKVGESEWEEQEEIGERRKKG